LPGKRKKNEPEVLGFFGLGLDDKDGHQRVTKSEHFYLLGGSAETHERMQETAIKFGESLEHKGKTLQEATFEEILEIFHESLR